MKKTVLVGRWLSSARSHVIRNDILLRLNRRKSKSPQSQDHLASSMSVICWARYLFCDLISACSIQRRLVKRWIRRSWWSTIEEETESFLTVVESFSFVASLSNCQGFYWVLRGCLYRMHITQYHRDTIGKILVLEALAGLQLKRRVRAFHRYSNHWH